MSLSKPLQDDNPFFYNLSVNSDLDQYLDYYFYFINWLCFKTITITFWKSLEPQCSHLCCICTCVFHCPDRSGFSVIQFLQCHFSPCPLSCLPRRLFPSLCLKCCWRDLTFSHTDSSIHVTLFSRVQYCCTVSLNHPWNVILTEY